jgi:eukaryotic-like serine/threonine-protein kinase
MTPSRWHDVKEIAADALELPPQKRSAYILEACGDDSALKGEVERLVAASESETGPLDHPFPYTVDPSLPFGMRLCDRFRIGHLLARGGMGEVYRARDEMMREDVALKIISREIADRPGVVDRFRHEVQRARRITHPNVCRIHDLYLHTAADGSVLHFLTMHLLRGPTLAELIRDKKAIPLAEALPLLNDLSAGLEAAHEAGIAHCDLKPNNVLIDRVDGERPRAVITDFGLARALRADVGGDASALSIVVGGAPAYMAPELRFGGSEGVAVDIFAFGIIASELLTGRHPFERKPAWEFGPGYRVPSARTMGITIPAEWEAAISRCIEFDPKRRFVSMTELRAAVESGDSGAAGWGRKRFARRALPYAVAGLVAGAAGFLRYRGSPAKPEVIAVLPFEIQKDAGLDFLGDGITESLINSLSQLPQLQVPAVGQVRRFKGESVPTKAGEMLHASSVLAGRVRQREGLLSVEVELIDVSSGRQLWGSQYNLALTNVLEVQESICSGILSGLQLRLGERETKILRRGLTSNEAAYQLYLRGQYFLGLRTVESLQRSHELFSEAVGQDPKFALAYCGLASARLLLGYFGADSPLNSMPAAKAAARQAIAIEPTVADAYSVLGFAQAIFDWDRNAAEGSFRRAISLRPDLAPAHHWYAQAVLGPLARYTEAVAETKRALTFDPLSSIIQTNLGVTLYYSRRFDDAIRQLLKVVEMEPGFAISYWTLGQAWAAERNLTKAVQAHETARSLQPGAKPDLSLAYCYAVCGKPAEARGLLEHVVGDYRRPAYSAYELAYVQGALGDSDAAFRSLELSWADKEPQLNDIGVDPKFDPLRKNPAYPGILRRVGLNPGAY